MSKTNNIAEKSVNNFHKKNKYPLMDENWKKHLLKTIAITLVLISLAVISVSDGQLIF